MPQNIKVKMKIVIFDQHPVYLESFKLFFESNEKFEIDGLFLKKRNMLNHLSNNYVDIIITECICDDYTGLKWICQIRKLCPNSIIIVYSYLSTELAPEIIYRTGADGFINKKSSLKEIYNLILEILKNHSNRNFVKPKSTYLTKKEIVIINFMIKGLSSNEIAELTGSSNNTINNQKNILLSKFNCRSSNQLIAKLFRLGLIQL